MPKDEDDAPRRKREDSRGEKREGSRGGPGGKVEKSGEPGGGKDEKPREVSAVIDRLEGDMAVLSLGGGKRTLDVPVSRLPEGASDGDHLRLTFDGEPGADTLKRVSKDEGSRAAAEDRISKLREELKQRGGAAGKKDFKL
jgi:hypothetical protein